MEGVWADRDVFADISDPWNRDIREERHRAVIVRPGAVEHAGKSRHADLHSRRDGLPDSDGRHESAESSEFHRLCQAAFETNPHIFLRVAVVMLIGAIAFATYSIILLKMSASVSFGKVAFAILLAIASAGFFSLWRDMRRRIR